MSIDELSITSKLLADKVDIDGFYSTLESLYVGADLKSKELGKKPLIIIGDTHGSECPIWCRYFL